MVNGGGGAYLTRTDTIPPAPEMDLGTSRPLREGTDFSCYPPRERSGERFAGWKRWLPAWLVGENAPPYFKSFVTVDVAGGHLLVRALGVEDFDRTSLESPPIWEQETPLSCVPDSTANSA